MGICELKRLAIVGGTIIYQRLDEMRKVELILVGNLKYKTISEWLRKDMKCTTKELPYDGYTKECFPLWRFPVRDLDLALVGVDVVVTSTVSPYIHNIRRTV